MYIFRLRPVSGTQGEVEHCIRLSHPENRAPVCPVVPDMSGSNHANSHTSPTVEFAQPMQLATKRRLLSGASFKNGVTACEKDCLPAQTVRTQCMDVEMVAKISSPGNRSYSIR